MLHNTKGIEPKLTLRSWFWQTVIGGVLFTPFIKSAHLMNTTECTQRRTCFLGIEFPIDIFSGVADNRNAWIAPALRAEVYISILTYVEISRAGPAFPVIGFAMHQVLLKQPVVEAM